MRGVRRADRELGVGPARLSALSVLLAGPRTLGELAEAEQVSAPTMSRIAAGLVSSRLARRLSHPSDRRSVRLEMTPAGRALIEAGRQARVERLAAALAELGPEERAALEKALPALEQVALALLQAERSDAQKKK